VIAVAVMAIAVDVADMVTDQWVPEWVELQLQHFLHQHQQLAHNK